MAPLGCCPCTLAPSPDRAVTVACQRLLHCPAFMACAACYVSMFLTRAVVCPLQPPQLRPEVEAALHRLLASPDTNSTFHNPVVHAALQDVRGDLRNITKYRDDPAVMQVGRSGRGSGSHRVPSPFCTGGGLGCFAWWSCPTRFPSWDLV